MDRRLVLLCVLLTGCPIGFDEDVVQQSEMTVTVTDGSAPLKGATVVFAHWSEPHNEKEHESTETTDAKGKARFDRIMTEETSYPFCLHGVRAHEYGACVSRPGFLTTRFAITDPEAGLRITVPLSKGKSRPCHYDLAARASAYSKGKPAASGLGPFEELKHWPAASASASGSAPVAASASASALASATASVSASASAAP